MSRKFAGIFLAIMMMFTFAACGVSTGTTETKVQVGGGPMEGAKIKGCVKPGTKDNTPQGFDKFFGYPTGSERDYDATGQKDSDAKPITVLSRDNAELAIPIIVRFNLTSDCDMLKKFHKAHGDRYSAYLDDGRTTSGWLLMLRKLMYDPMDATLDDLAKDYNWRDLYNNAAVQKDLAAKFKETIDDLVKENARGEYFENFSVLVKKPYPTDADLLKNVKAEQSAVAGAASAEAKARAEKAQAEAETFTAKAQAEKRRAEIAGYGGIDNYLRSKAIENGQNPFQPQYIVGGSK